MAEYKSQYTGEQIDAGINAANNAAAKNALHSLLIPILRAGIFEDNQADNIRALEQYLYTGAAIPAESIALSEDFINISAGLSKTLTATVQPPNTTDVVTWSSSNENVATVQGGVITPVGDGICEISAQAGEHTVVCHANVRMKNIIINDGAGAAVGMVDRKPTADQYSRIAYVAESPTRAVLNPLAYYITPGKNYKIWLTDTSDYYLGYYLLAQDGTRLDFNYTNGISKVFYMDFEETLDAGWQYNGMPAEFTAGDTTNLIAPIFCRKDNAAITEDDLDILRRIAMIEEVRT